MVQENPLDAATDLELATLDAYIFEGSWKGAAYHLDVTPRAAQKRMQQLYERIELRPGIARVAYWRGLQRGREARASVRCAS